MDELLEIAAAHGLVVIEDAAHCLLASYRERPLGTLGNLGTFSFHHTKNVTSGEGGALLINDPELLERAEVVWEKGTEPGALRARRSRPLHLGRRRLLLRRQRAHRRLSSGASWRRPRRSPARRLAIWQRYHEAFAELEAEGLAQRPRSAVRPQPQRPPLLPDPAQRAGPRRLHRRDAGGRGRDLVPLRAAAQLACGASGSAARSAISPRPSS